MSDCGMLLIEDNEILKELHSFYNNLFYERPRMLEVELATSELLEHIENLIDINTNIKLKNCLP